MKRFASVLVAALLFTACSDDGTGPEASLAGTYTLRTVNGQNLPFTFFQAAGYKAEILSDTYTVNANGTFSNTAQFRETEGTTVTTTSETYTGTWTQSGNAIVFKDNEGDSQTATFTGGNTLTMTAEGLVAVYRK